MIFEALMINEASEGGPKQPNTGIPWRIPRSRIKQQEVAEEKREPGPPITTTTIPFSPNCLFSLWLFKSHASSSVLCFDFVLNSWVLATKEDIHSTIIIRIILSKLYRDHHCRDWKKNQGETRDND